MVETKKGVSLFKVLSEIDVSKHVDKKMNLNYLSWPWAWSLMKSFDPNASKEYTKFDELNDDGTKTGRQVDYLKTKTGVIVECTVTIKGHSETESLPVMDYKNKAVSNPDAMQINKAKQRCFVKALALQGLGISLYSGEDLPNKETNKIKSNNKPSSSSPAPEKWKLAIEKRLNQYADMIGIDRAKYIDEYFTNKKIVPSKMTRDQATKVGKEIDMLLKQKQTGDNN